MQTPTFTTTQLRRRTRRGQSIVVALLVLLLLGIAGALFITVVARNLINARHANRVVTADEYSRAGITYADAQLSGSLDGADWRPPLQFQLAAAPTEAREAARYNAAVAANALPAVNPSDPDLAYLQAGYARYNTGAGRFLLRLTYVPVVSRDPQGQYYDPTIGVDASGLAKVPIAVPPGKYLKIEAIGREGVIDSLDPTTYTNNRSTDRTQSYQVAYKPIGITDYARFETNPDKRSDIANLGVASQLYMGNQDGDVATPGVSDFSTTTNANGQRDIQEYPVLTTYGAPDAYLQTTATPPVLYPNPNAGSGGTAPTNSTFVAGGGSIHANMATRFFGVNVMYLHNAGASAPLYQDGAEIAGDLLLDNYDPRAKLNNSVLDGTVTPSAGQQASLILNPATLTDLSGFISTNPVTYVSPSNTTGTVNAPFDTQGGLVRDGSAQNDPEGLPRGITRLEPPLMDALDTASQMPRYKAIAMNSAPRIDPNTGRAYPPNANGTSPSAYGYGKAIYVNNTADVQPDSASINGGSTLTDEWLHRTSSGAGGVSKGNWNGQFYDPPGVSIVLGQRLPSSGSSSAASYGIRLVRSSGDSFVGPDGATSAGTTMDVPYTSLDTDRTGAASDNDIVIYAEGNVRVRGILSPNEGTGTGTNATYVPRHITIVTGGTAYIEGNLLKGTPDSSISVLAHDYVCVNTTQFLAGTNVEDRTDGSQNPQQTASGDTLGQSSTVSLDAGHSLLQEFNFGLTNGDTPYSKYMLPAPPAPNSKLALYVSGGPAGVGSTLADFNIFGPSGTSIFSAPPLVQPLTTFTHLTYDLSALVTPPVNSNPLFSATATDLFHLSVSKDVGSENNSGATDDVALERVAVLPMDIRIEAVLYAQTRSFFVIPGDWFNTNRADNLQAYHDSGTRQDVQAGSLSAADVESRSRFPMYGQPIDLKITIDGTVSEARPADIAAQSEWMRRWGWIPQYHGDLIGTTNGPPAELAGHVQFDNGSPPARANVPAIGLQIIYDPEAGYPYSSSLTQTAPGVANPAHYLRSDQYGRPLPFTPKLPVSTGLLYSGESGEPPLLQ